MTSADILFIERKTHEEESKVTKQRDRQTETEMETGGRKDSQYWIKEIHETDRIELKKSSLQITANTHRHISSSSSHT